jgi:hypothetical protein
MPINESNWDNGGSRDAKSSLAPCSESSAPSTALRIAVSPPAMILSSPILSVQHENMIMEIAYPTN